MAPGGRLATKEHGASRQTPATGPYDVILTAPLPARLQTIKVTAQDTT